jgi:hypothetical protein
MPTKQLNKKKTKKTTMKVKKTTRMMTKGLTRASKTTKMISRFYLMEVNNQLEELAACLGKLPFQ